MVRSDFYIEPTEAGHDHVYELVAEGEVWIDVGSSKRRRLWAA